MDKQRKRRKLNPLYIVAVNDELRLRQEEALREIEAYEKSKEMAEVTEVREVLENNNLQSEFLLSQILNELKEVSKEVREIRSLVGQMAEGQYNLENAILSRLTIFEEHINRK